MPRKKILVETWKSPHDEFVYGREELTIEQIAEKWHGKHKKIKYLSKDIHGDQCDQVWDREEILTMYRRQDWEFTRKHFQRSTEIRTVQRYQEKLVEIDAQELADATKKHREVGNRLINIFMRHTEGGRFVDEHGNPLEVKPTDVIRSGKEGVGVERKALGLADDAVRIEFINKVCCIVNETIVKYVDDPSVLRSIGKDLERDLRKVIDVPDEIKP